MNVVLWVLQGLLALAFLLSGGMKLLRPKESLESVMSWVEDFSPGMIKLIGTVEILAALGLILPAVTGIATVLTPLAAVGLVLVMVGAAVTHGRRHEFPVVGINAVLLVLAAVVVWGRFGPYPLG
ncbi:MAG: DoxX family protein [Streptosporangiales bacterium]|nr:DoxX family protein [Streptosporangiales bacterium]